MAYQRYLEKEKAEMQQNKEVLSLEKQIEEIKTENIMLKTKISKQPSSDQSSFPDVSVYHT